MNLKHHGCAELFCLAFIVLIPLGLLFLVCTCSENSHHREVEASPITVIDGQKFHLHNSHLYPIIKIGGEEKTVYNN